MSILGDIWTKITGGAETTAPPTATTATAAADPAANPTTSSEVDVEQILTTLAAQKGAAYNWQTSIVDLLKLLDMDSSLTARKDLADELNVHEGADGSAEQNLALRRAVMQKLEENGGKVPDSLKS
jgi:hypothetical protein